MFRGQEGSRGPSAHFRMAPAVGCGEHRACVVELRRAVQQLAACLEELKRCKGSDSNDKKQRRCENDEMAARSMSRRVDRGGMRSGQLHRCVILRGKEDDSFMSGKKEESRAEA